MALPTISILSPSGVKAFGDRLLETNFIRTFALQHPGKASLLRMLLAFAEKRILPPLFCVLNK
ncbi:hypothetical protein DQG23_34855 [Paenibacillus contaminans]|uniref:Uncharacterized protein n=1 Tax=Paenibacillus contaminans TaxID=450362 RepID=A0A329LXB2_9BACL|nr:hypothetical protein DQG23_34855 [Paenibacillus contaminans]